ncbi:pitrilysin family protein [Limnothrix sp. FACHB-881]|uniref:M16 family metallopeptidase n=1 Tax=Limnothrix sp. FACHB-881 TaxID=2692819 RepID=UPI001F5507F0|nr:pitrilysin family protein [Limnothrix sp. FACHB-881]
MLSGINHGKWQQLGRSGDRLALVHHLGQVLRDQGLGLVRAIGLVAGLAGLTGSLWLGSGVVSAAWALDTSPWLSAPSMATVAPDAAANVISTSPTSEPTSGPVVSNVISKDVTTAGLNGHSATAKAASIKPYLDRVQQQITEFTLKNGMKFIVLERHQAPVVSFMTYANVGGAEEPDGKTGVAHFLEHLAFKGSSRIGTTDFESEKAILDRMDALMAQYETVRDQGKTAEAQQLRQQLLALEQQAQPFVKQNEFGRLVEQAGGVGLNATTSADATRYFYSFPANKLELWMSLESERFLDPVFREFYKEQDVILEERRMRTDNSPIGKAVEVFLESAFKVHPYHRPVIGYDEDIRNLTRLDVRRFYEAHYPPNNLTAVVVGDVVPTEVKRLAEIYFGRFQRRPLPNLPIPVEPRQTATRSVNLQLESQPWYLEGYHAPAKTDPDYVVYEAIASLLSDGRTSRLYQSVVQEKQLALSIAGLYGFPGDRYPTLMLFYALSAPDHSVDEIAVELHRQLDRLKNEPVSEAELERVKTQARANQLRAIDSNSTMAALLAEYQAKTGNWRNLFAELDRIGSISPADVQRVARKTFTPENRTVLKLLPK